MANLNKHQQQKLNYFFILTDSHRYVIPIQFEQRSSNRLVWYRYPTGLYETKS